MLERIGWLVIVALLATSCAMAQSRWQIGTPVVTYLRAHPCNGLTRLLDTTTVDGRPVGFAEARLGFAGAADAVYRVAGDFRRLVEAAQKKGRRVSVVSTIRTQPPMVADELRRQADNFIELDELKPMIMREGGPRNHNAAPAYAHTA